MRTDLTREKALKTLGVAMQKSGWVLTAMATANTGLQDTGLVEEEAAQERLGEALEDIEAAMEALAEVKAYLKEQTEIAPTAMAASAC